MADVKWFSVNFEQFQLDQRLYRGIEAAGFKQPTPIQSQAIPVVLEKKDVLGLAQTGTGKTAAFMLPILQHLTSGPLRTIRVLIVAPTRELAEQIHVAGKTLARHTKIKSVSIYGGVGKGKQVEQLNRGVEIVVACPGRLLDLHGEGKINLSNVEILVLDEADRMCDMGFMPDIRRIVKLLPKQRQSLFFSATMPSDIRELADTILTDPVTVQIGMVAPAKTVSHALYPITQKRKKELLMALLDETPTGRLLIFTRTKYRARNLARDLGRQGYNAAALQGNMSQNQRVAAMNGFRSGKIDILVATDIAARGIDVAEISHVINFDMPDTVDAYTHRIGRTGRAKQNGAAFTFVTADDKAMIRSIERLLGEQIERRSVANFNYNEFNPSELAAEPLQNNNRQSSRNGSSNSGGRQRNNQSRDRQQQGNRQQGASASANGSAQKKKRRRRRRPPQKMAG